LGVATVIEQLTGVHYTPGALMEDLGRQGPGLTTTRQELWERYLYLYLAGRADHGGLGDGSQSSLAHAEKKQMGRPPRYPPLGALAQPASLKKMAPQLPVGAWRTVIGGPRLGGTIISSRVKEWLLVEWQKGAKPGLAGRKAKCNLAILRADQALATHGVAARA
jgi:hypothetical protein